MNSVSSGNAFNNHEDVPLEYTKTFGPNDIVLPAGTKSSMEFAHKTEEVKEKPKIAISENIKQHILNDQSEYDDDEPQKVDSNIDQNQRQVTEANKTESEEVENTVPYELNKSQQIIQKEIEKQKEIYETSHIVEDKPQELYKLPQNYFSN